MTPELSVVVPSYARPRETLRAIRSALRQREVELEIVVVDDGSPVPLDVPDPLRETGRVQLVRLSRNGGAAAARNEGVAAASGAYIAFLDSDDFFLPDTLARRLAWLRSRKDWHQRPVLCVSPVWRWTRGRNASLSVPAPAADIEALAAGCWYFPGSTALFSRITWDTVGPFDADLRRLEDLDWGIRLARAGGQVVVAPVPAAAVHRSRPAGTKAVRSSAKRIEARFAPQSPTGIAPAAYRKLRAYLALERANSALGERAIHRFAAAMLHSLVLQPRLSVHQGPWWVERPGSPEEVRHIEELARELEEPDRAP